MSRQLALFGGTPVRAKPFTSWPIFGKPEERRLLSTLRSGKWGRLHGNEVAQFEKRFAEMHGCKHGIAVVNGTVSLRIALMAAGIRAEDEVIIPPYTFFSTASAVITCCWRRRSIKRPAIRATYAAMSPASVKMGASTRMRRSGRRWRSRHWGTAGARGRCWG